MKEKYGYVASDIVKEYKKFDKKEKAEDGKYYLNNKFKKYIHKPSNGGKPVEIDVGYERFLGPEMFFHPVSSHPLIYPLTFFNVGIHEQRSLRASRRVHR